MDDLAGLPARLREFYALWDGKRDGRPFPARADFPFDELGPWIGGLHVVEVLADGDFRFKVFASKSAVRMRHEYTGRLLSEIGPTSWVARDAAVDYAKCVQARRPVFADRTRREADGRLYSWRRLIVPLGQGEAIDHLFVCMDYDYI